MPSVFIIAAIFLFLIFLKAMQLEKTNGIQFPIYNKIKTHWQQVILAIAWIIFVTHGFLNKTPLHICIIGAFIMVLLLYFIIFIIKFLITILKVECK